MVLKVSDRLATGGAGYIGSHIVVKPCEAGYSSGSRHFTTVLVQ